MQATLFGRDEKTPIFHNAERLVDDALCVRFTPTQLEKIEALAARHNVRKAAACRWFVEYAIQHAQVS